MWKIGCLVVVWAAMLCGCATAPVSMRDDLRIVVGPFTATDAASHQSRIQDALDAHRDRSTRFDFVPGEYHMSDARGLRIPAGATLKLNGAVFRWASDIRDDGQTFLIEDAANVTIDGGTIVGHRETWGGAVNVAGIRVRGRSDHFSVANLVCRDLSSNAIGVFGESDENPIRNILISGVRTDNCCNYYGDYLDKDIGPAKGSERTDQGSVALYYVTDWTVKDCTFRDSQSDGTHFFHAHRGQFINSSVTGSKMGGYFLESCNDVVASDSVMRRNGSRGVTIERDSARCTLTESVVSESGREGVWAPDVSDVRITNNEFRHNGRKNDARKDCEIRLDETSQFKTVTSKILIQGNSFTTTAHQTAVIYVSEDVRDVVVDANHTDGTIPVIFGTEQARAGIKYTP